MHFKLCLSIIERSNVRLVDGSAVFIVGLYAFKNRIGIFISHNSNKHYWENVIHVPKINIFIESLSADWVEFMY